VFNLGLTDFIFALMGASRHFYQVVGHS